MTRRRMGTFASITAVGLATGFAWAAGSRLNAGLPERLLDRSTTRIAQASGDGANPGRLRRVAQRPQVSDDDVGLTPLDTFLQVYQLVKQNYVDRLPDDRKMTHGAIRAMLADLNDPNSRFLEPAEREALDNEARGRYAGIGAPVSILARKRDGHTEHKIVIVAPLPGSPAEKAGLRPGDVVTHVDGKWVLGSDPFVAANRVLQRVKARDADEEDLQKAVEAAQQRVRGGMTLVQAQKKLTTGQDAKHTLTVQRAGVKDPVKVEVTTAVTEVAPLVARTLPGGVGYIKLNVLTEKSAAAFKQALADLPRQPGLVLDLRGNPGGLLQPAVEIGAQLTRGGNLFVEMGPQNKRRAVTTPVAQNRATRPIVVLVDRGTAALAEALAASLRDKGVGTLLGGRTFGDAMVQTLYALPDGSAYTLTTGKLLSPGGTSWHGAGLTPQLAVAGSTPEDQVLTRAVSVLKNRANVAAAARGRASADAARR